jgi:hypothetical protein
MRLRNLITVALIAVLFASLAALPAAAQQPTDTDQVSFVWFANVGADAPAVDIYFGDSTTPVVSNLAFGTVTQMYVFPSNQSGFVLREAGSDSSSDPIFTADWGLTPNQSYLILATGLTSKQAFILEPVTLIRQATTGKAHVRIINTVSGESSLSVMDSTNTAIGTSLPYLGVADVDLDPASANLTIQDATGASVATHSADFQADTNYIMLITGGAEGTPAISVQVAEVPLETTRVKIVNSADANYDVMLKRTDAQEAFAMNIAPAADGEFIEVPSGAATFVLKSAGAGADGQEIFAAPIQLRPSRDVTLTIQGTGDQVELVVTSDVLMEGLTVAGGTGTPVEATAEATADATAAATTPQAITATPVATLEPTGEATAEPTSEVTLEPTKDATIEPTGVSAPIS